MPIYGSALYGSAVYGAMPAGPSALATLRSIVGGWAPWLPDNVTTWRSKCVRLYPVDPVTFAWGTTPLVQLTDGLVRRIEARDTFLAQDTLNIQVADPQGLYQPGGADAALLAPGALVGLQNTVTTAAGSLTFRPNVYRIVQALTTGQDRYGVDVGDTTAEDWLRALLDQPFPTGVTTPWGPIPTSIGGVLLSPFLHAIAVKDWVIAQGPPAPPPLDIGRYSGVAICLLWLLTQQRLQVDDSVPLGPLLPDQTSEAFRKYFQDPLMGKTGYASWRNILEFLATENPWRLAYLDDGVVLMLDGAGRRDSGYLASCAADHPGAFPIPWEKVSRQTGRPQFTEVDIWYHWLNDEHPPQPEFIRAAHVESTHPLMPNFVPLGRPDNVILDFATAQALPGASATESVDPVALRRLQKYLSDADPVTLTVDSACPPPIAGDEVGLWLPDEHIEMRAAFLGATIPQNTQAASWSLGWRGPY